jgi:hypothetical protein
MALLAFVIDIDLQLKMLCYKFNSSDDDSIAMDLLELWKQTNLGYF